MMTSQQQDLFGPVWCEREEEQFGWLDAASSGWNDYSRKLSGERLAAYLRGYMHYLETNGSIWRGKLMEYPDLGIDTAALVAEVERLLALAAESKDEMGAVNWGDLRVCDVEYRMSMVVKAAKPYCVVLVQEASPDCALALWISQRLDKDKFPNTHVECAW